jgi:PKD repeat protein
MGGIGYVGVFNHTSTRYKPAFVMSANLSGSKNLAEAASHEVGHNLGLDHDGNASGGYYQGHADWAPIMGNGYYRSVTQWSKGEYSGANNQQDDLAVIQAHGAPLIADDYGNNAGSASVLSGTNISVSGLITTREDIDVFRFTTGTGNVSINLSPAVLGANLDIEAKILDASGNVVATSNPAGLSASFNQYLGAGTYYLTIDGTGSGDGATGYSDYASIGQYSISGTLASGGAQQQAPNAAASANVTSGTTPLTVAFFGSNSSDADGHIAGYRWNFGDGSADSTEPNPVHVYYSAGTFTATLTVTDNAGLSSSRTISISATQTANQAPVAIAATNATSGYAPLTINFTGASSYDTDGSISSYQWSFGNGATSNQANASYAYTTPGTYTATLTVTDNRGASNSNSVVINVLQQQTVSNFIYVGNISLTLVQSGRAGQATVTVYDSTGARRSGVTVAGNWSGLVIGSATGVTDSNGQVVFTSIPSKRRGTFTFTVSNLSAPGYTYNSALNSATKVSTSK